MIKSILIGFAVLQGIAIGLGMINAGDWNIGHWDAATRNTVATLPVSIIAVILLLGAAGESDRRNK